MHLTCGGHVQRPLTCGPNGWLTDQTPWPVSPTLQPPVTFLGGDAFQEPVEWNSRLKVGGGHAQWSTDHMARPAGQHLACYRLNQAGNSLDPYK
jgi:hypothetical protein